VGRSPHSQGFCFSTSLFLLSVHLRRLSRFFAVPLDFLIYLGRVGEGPICEAPLCEWSLRPDRGAHGRRVRFGHGKKSSAPACLRVSVERDFPGYSNEVVSREAFVL